MSASVPSLDLQEKWIEADPGKFRDYFNRKSFEISHHMASHPLFQLPPLMDLAERTLKTRPVDLYYDAGDIRIDQRWDATPKKPFSPQEALQRIETCGAWFIFRSAQKDPEYRLFLDKGLEELKTLIG